MALDVQELQQRRFTSPWQFWETVLPACWKFINDSNRHRVYSVGKSVLIRQSKQKLQQKERFLFFFNMSEAMKNEICSTVNSFYWISFTFLPVGISSLSDDSPVNLFWWRKADDEMDT